MPCLAVVHPRSRTTTIILSTALCILFSPTIYDLSSLSLMLSDCRLFGRQLQLLPDHVVCGDVLLDVMASLNPLKGRVVNWLHLLAIQV